MFPAQRLVFLRQLRKHGQRERRNFNEEVVIKSRQHTWAVLRVCRRLNTASKALELNHVLFCLEDVRASLRTLRPLDSGGRYTVSSGHLKPVSTRISDH